MLMAPVKMRSNYFNQFQYEYEGKIFSSKRKCCDYYDIKYSSVMSYQSKYNCSTAEAITYYRNLKEKKSFIFHNRKWKNLDTCCDYYGLNAASVKTYMWDNKCTVEESLEHAYASQKKRSIVYHGVRYKSIKACCEAYGINATSVCHYKNQKKLSVTRSITHYIKNEKKYFVFRNIKYENMKECSRKYNLNPRNVSSLASKEHITHQKAIEILLKRKEDAIFSFMGIDYPSFEKCCAELDINSSSVRSRAWRLNCSLEESLKHYFDHRQIIKDKKIFIFRNIEYKSMTECSRKYNLSPQSVSYLANKDHITHQEAIEILLKRREDDVFSFMGIDYPSFVKCCAELGINSSSVWSRAWRLNCSLEESLEHFYEQKH